MTDHHNQRLVPDSFLALHARHGRPTADRATVERRHELAEDLALHLAALPALAALEDRGDRSSALARCRAGLLAEPAQVSAPEADWVVRRLAELLDWDVDPPANRPIAPD